VTASGIERKGGAQPVGGGFRPYGAGLIDALSGCVADGRQPVKIDHSIEKLLQ